jgi:hypothetical protein
VNRGDSVTLVVEDLRAGERRIALSPLEVRENAGQGGGGRENEDWKGYKAAAKPAEKSAPGGMGNLGDMLAQAKAQKGRK